MRKLRAGKEPLLKEINKLKKEISTLKRQKGLYLKIDRLTKDLEWFEEYLDSK